MDERSADRGLNSSVISGSWTAPHEVAIRSH